MPPARTRSSARLAPTPHASLAPAAAAQVIPEGLFVHVSLIKKLELEDNVIQLLPKDISALQ